MIMIRFLTILYIVSIIILGLTISLVRIIGNTLPPSALLAFSSALGTEAPQVYILDMQRHIAVNIGDVESPTWSKTGQFAFVSTSDGNSEVYILDGSTLTNISQSPADD